MSAKVNHRPSTSLVLDQSVSRLLDISLPRSNHSCRNERETVRPLFSRIPISHASAKSQLKNISISRKLVLPPPIPGATSNSRVNHLTSTRQKKENSASANTVSRVIQTQDFGPLATRKPQNPNISPPQDAKTITATGIDPLVLRTRGKEKQPEKEAKGADKVRTRLKEREQGNDRKEELEAAGHRRKENSEISPQKSGLLLGAFTTNTSSKHPARTVDVQKRPLPSRASKSQTEPKLRNAERARTARIQIARKIGTDQESYQDSPHSTKKKPRANGRTSATIISPIVTEKKSPLTHGRFEYSWHLVDSNSTLAENQINKNPALTGNPPAGSPSGLKYHIKMSIGQQVLQSYDHCLQHDRQKSSSLQILSVGSLDRARSFNDREF